MSVPPPTRVQRLKADFNANWDRHQRDVRLAAREDFPVGMRVRWIYTYKSGQPVWRAGVVREHATYHIKIESPTGAIHVKDFHDLWPDD